MMSIRPTLSVLQLRVLKHLAATPGAFLESMTVADNRCHLEPGFARVKGATFWSLLGRKFIEPFRCGSLLYATKESPFDKNLPWYAVHYRISTAGREILG